MPKANTKPSAAIVYDVQTANHASDSVKGDLLLLADAKRLGGIASKEWRTGFMVGTVAAILGKTLDYAADLLAKAAPDSKGKPKRTQAEQKVYDAARTRLSRFCKTHSIKPANKQRGKPGAVSDKSVTKEDVTPKAINAKQADTFLRQHVAMLQAYGEKNKAVISQAWLDAIGEINEAASAIPNQD